MECYMEEWSREQSRVEGRSRASATMDRVKRDRQYAASAVDISSDSGKAENEDADKASRASASRKVVPCGSWKRCGA